MLHVVDASVEEGRLREMVRSVEDVLQEIGAAEVPVVMVLNKIDRVDPLGRRRLANLFPDAPQISAATGEGVPALRSFLAERFADRWETVRLLVPYEDGARLSELYALGTPIEERDDTEEGVMVVARLPRRELQRFAPYLVAGATRLEGLESA